MMDQTQTMLVPTVRTKPKKELDIGRMSESDLKSLQRTDPFMYHSIPAVHRANLSLKSTDPSQVASSVASEASQSSAVVRRKTQLSTECHESVLLQDLLDDEEFGPREFEVPPNLAALFDGPSGGPAPREFEAPAGLAALFGVPPDASDRNHSVPAVHKDDISLESTDPSHATSSELTTERQESVLLQSLLDGEEFVPLEFEVWKRAAGGSGRKRKR